MRQAVHTLVVASGGSGLYEITKEVARWVGQQRMSTGLLTLFCRHTSASLLIQENASPSVKSDLQTFFDALTPEQAGHYLHDDEGPDDMPAHLRTALGKTSLSIPILEGVAALGVWQGIFLYEHRRAPHRRKVVLHIIGE